jgi:hypothetical protein
LAPWQFIHPTRVRHVPMLPLTDVEAWRAERAPGVWPYAQRYRRARGDA